MIGLYVANCGIATSTKAEFLAVLRGLSYAWNKGIKQLILEVDSMVVVQSLLGDLNHSSPYYHIVRRSHELVRRQEWNVKIQHCYKEANRAAD